MFFLITRPRYELITHYLYYWSEIIIKGAEQRKITFVDLKKGKASRKLVESYLNKQPVKIVIFNGHGNDVCITGHNEEPLIESGKNSYLLKDRVVYMRSCDSGKVLGPQLIKEGAKAFIGYKELFRFWTDANSIRKPLQDEYARPFFETSNQVAISLVKGKIARESHEDSLRMYEQVIGKLLTSNMPNSFIVSDLIWNMHNQICLE